MRALSIPTGEQVRSVPISDRSGKVLCTVYIDSLDTTFHDRFLTAKKTMDEALERIADVSLNADGTPTSARYAFAVNKAEREVKRAITHLLAIDRPDSLFSHRLFASVKGGFYCTLVLGALEQAVKQSLEAYRVQC